MEHASPSAPFSLRARYLFPIAGPPIHDGVVSIAAGRIAAIGPRSTHSPPSLDLGDVAIVPGLVNAHTHLEFSSLSSPLGSPCMALPEWLAEVLSARGREADVAAAIGRGLEESAAAGVTMLGEIATNPWPATLSRPPMPIVMFRELIGLSEERATAALGIAKEHLGAAATFVEPGLSPHAPYTVHPNLLATAVSLAARHRAPVAMHSGGVTRRVGALGHGRRPHGAAARSARRMAARAFRRSRRGANPRGAVRAPRALVVHGNYLATDEQQFLAERAETMSVVYCPRTHDYFGHASYPLAEMLARGVRVALGTDSRASNPDLSLLGELRFIAGRHGNVSPATILELGALAGARALGHDRETGSLEVGKRADLCVIPLAHGEASDPHALLFDSDLPAMETWISGRRVVRRDAH